MSWTGKCSLVFSAKPMKCHELKNTIKQECTLLVYHFLLGTYFNSDMAVNQYKLPKRQKRKVLKTYQLINPLLSTVSSIFKKYICLSKTVWNSWSVIGFIFKSIVLF